MRVEIQLFLKYKLWFVNIMYGTIIKLLAVTDRIHNNKCTQASKIYNYNIYYNFQFFYQNAPYHPVLAWNLYLIFGIWFQHILFVLLHEFGLGLLVTVCYPKWSFSPYSNFSRPHSNGAYWFRCLVQKIN